MTTIFIFWSKTSKNKVFFDFRMVYRPTEISGRKKNFPKIGQNVYFSAQKILEAYGSNLFEILKFVRGGGGGGGGGLDSVIPVDCDRY